MACSIVIVLFPFLEYDFSVPKNVLSSLMSPVPRPNHLPFLSANNNSIVSLEELELINKNKFWHIVTYVVINPGPKFYSLISCLLLIF